MRDRSPQQKTLIAMLREAVDAWRRRQRWSMATVVDEIVKTHEAMGFDVLADIHFEPNRDEVRRMQTNAERVSRWLDDMTKTNNLLPANFVRSVLVALPRDLRIQVVDEFLEGSGLACRVVLEAVQGPAMASDVVACVARESGEATAAIAALVADAGHERLHQARRELTESIAAQSEALARVEAAIARGV